MQSNRLPEIGDGLVHGEALSDYRQFETLGDVELVSLGYDGVNCAAFGQDAVALLVVVVRV